MLLALLNVQLIGLLIQSLVPLVPLDPCVFHIPVEVQSQRSAISTVL